MSGVIVIGGGQSGLEAAAALRKEQYAGPVTLVCEEPHAPYQRPALSKDYLHGKMDADRLELRALTFYQAQHIDLLLGARVESINCAAHRVQLQSGGSLNYDKLILAVGARNRPLNLPGAESALYLRSLDEARALKQRIAEARSIAVIGGGFIGLEVAAAARLQGKTVIVIESQSRLMARAVPPLLSEFFRDLHRSQGVDVRLNTGVAAIENGAVRLTDGAFIPADLAVAGIGVIPNVDLARESGLTIGNGIQVDEFLRTTDSDIYAIGDCADHPNVFAGSRVRLESVQNAIDQAKCVARGIVGKAAAYNDVPWFWTDQYDVKFQMVGLSGGHDQEVLRGRMQDAKFSLFYFKAGRLVAVDSVNRFADHAGARKLLAAHAPLTPEQAADETLDLRKMSKP